MATIRIATFNLENLLQRFDFYRYGKLVKERALELLGVTDPEENMRLRKALFVALADDSRQMTAQAIRDTQADLICLQEVDNREVLDGFHDRYLKKSADVHYGWRRVLEGNDIRGIDVAVMSKDWIKVTSHAEHTFHDFDLHTPELADYGLDPGDRIFRRDCLEVETNVGSKDLFLFVCHFKSMSGGRDETMCVRDAEAKAVKKIITDKFNGSLAQEDWLIVGDLNDYVVDKNDQPIESGLTPLIENGFSINLLQKRIKLPSNRWTHFYAGERSFHQIDYILTSPALFAKNKTVKPKIVRNGQPYRVPGTNEVVRYPRVGFDRPKASDHCPVAVTLKV